MTWNCVLVSIYSVVAIISSWVHLHLRGIPLSKNLGEYATVCQILRKFLDQTQIRAPLSSQLLLMSRLSGKTMLAFSALLRLFFSRRV
ncbi:uncharacterized protein EDB93DRAFT_1168544 [Suillus bovinus]|uniref:uncharacterized protein n=1 Tax=Suillus bovinus TaxID=48563 RepID=UPI001B867A14|nr:uncharacterized protein EDB93DRAFT_1168544 [Suillus bovinus]KAG2136601.1 hypothetical protein EDB93DRAFT_1168544 [Suillus bovinus]